MTACALKCRIVMATFVSARKDLLEYTVKVRNYNAFMIRRFIYLAHGLKVDVLIIYQLFRYLQKKFLYPGLLVVVKNGTKREY